MAKSRKLEILQAQIDVIRAQSSLDEAIASLGDILQSKYVIAVAQAAKLIGERECRDLMPALVDAFERLMVHPAQADPNCHGKHAIIDALYRMNYSNESPFLQGIRHVQLEPVWGGKVDTAAHLRGSCAMGLVRMNYPSVLTELADLLADPESPARIAAARAIAYHGSAQGIPLLRLRALVGDEPQVIAEYMSALLTLDETHSGQLANQFLHDPNPHTQELVALTLGESHHPEALRMLTYWWSHTADPDLRRTGLLAIATLKTDDAIQFLLSIVAEHRQLDASHAVEALGLYRHIPDIWQQVQAIVKHRQQTEDWSINRLKS